MNSHLDVVHSHTVYWTNNKKKYNILYKYKSKTFYTKNKLTSYYL